MDNLINDYDKEPVYYCPRCLSLRVKADIADYCYCDNCGSTTIETASIQEWETMYKLKYGISYLEQ